ncbi:TonB-dependent receptor domain-containing protein [Flavobacterium pallidum]|uniref:TonB-dependent receptor n=1 Tax=Flavobacterium pallidum TaxID=2172098 RepID=A0A2S1SF50_9FLAO|nr:TonB-dependent receptor [Flavobacterium pallidum]AWI25030.1 TonB-dependent receptor [Flavobacterium pallidum]
MKLSRFAVLLFLFFIPFINVAQQRTEGEKVKVSGKIVEKGTTIPMEYTTITLQNTANPKIVTGGITNEKGEFNFEVSAGTYDIKIEFISFKPFEIKQKAITENTNLGTISLEPDATLLNEVEIRVDKTTVEIKLDKKVYNVGNDLMVKGGTVSDVLDNIPSVSVDADGVVSLRGNENVRILIDGKPSNAINITEALRQIPADAIDKVEVVTNPSARYDSEGGGGLLNIILKKGKNLGLNGTLILSTGDPENYGASGNLNFKSEGFNLFTTTGYNYRNNPGNSFTDTEYLNSDGTTRNFINEKRYNERVSEGVNSNFGIDLYLDKSTTWTNIFNYRKNNGNNPEEVTYNNFDANHENQFVTSRFNDQKSNSQNVEYSTNFTKNFKKQGHKFTIDASFSTNDDHDNSQIENNSDVLKFEKTSNDQSQTRNMIQSDYVLPIGKNSQFEAGYKGEFNKLLTDYEVDTLNTLINRYLPNPRYTNELQYNEKINALYTQFGTKIKKFSILLGMRWEDSNITINQLTTSDFNNKRYSNFFPSAFLTYEVSDQSSLSLSYSRRISRPRGRQINPFSNYSSNINIFQGNPDLNAAFTDALDLGYLKRWDKLTLSTSMYLNKTTDSFQFIRKESGDFVPVVSGGKDIVNNDGSVTIVDGEDYDIPVILSTPINLATEYRFGFEFTLNYSPYKWWKLNSNFNFFRNQTDGDYTYVDFKGNSISQNFDNTAYSWFTRLTSKVTLPYKIDWQTNLTYNGPQNNAQGRSLGVFSANLGFSKDLFKDKATVALNVQDVFNSRKRISDTNLPLLNSHSEMQWRVRQINLSFTYRFNKKKNEKERQPKRDSGDDGGDFQG